MNNLWVPPKLKNILQKLYSFNNPYPPKKKSKEVPLSQTIKASLESFKLYQKWVDGNTSPNPEIISWYSLYPNKLYA